MFARIVVGYNANDNECSGGLEKIQLGVAKGKWNAGEPKIDGSAEIVRLYNVSGHGCLADDDVNIYIVEYQRVGLRATLVGGSGDWRLQAYVGTWQMIGGDTPVQWSNDKSRRIAYGWELVATNGTSGGSQKEGINLPRLGSMVQAKFNWYASSIDQDVPYARSSVSGWNQGLSGLAGYADEPFDFYYDTFVNSSSNTQATAIIVNSP